MDGLRDYFTKPFCSKNKVDKTLFLVFILINGLVFFNAFFHESRIGYDFKGHLDNIKILSEFRLPARHESTQFFTPPLSYLPAAFIHSIIGPTSLKALKFSQLVNVVYSIALAFYLLKICDLIHPNNTAFKTITLGLVGMLPVYYKTFSFVRPEPLLAFLTVLAVYKALNVFVYDGYGVMEGVKLGFVFGLLILTKQQAFSLILGILLFAVLLALKRGGKSRACFMAAGLSLVLAFIVGGWFYLHLYHEYGTVFAFNREPFPRFSFSNRPRECYFGLGLGEVFIDPVRTSFRHHMLPKFYSELWGDWECYFIVYGLDVRSNRFIGRGIVLEEMLGGGVVPPWLKTNRYEVNGYLGRVNLVSLLPTAVFFMGIFSGIAYLGRFVAANVWDDRSAAFSLVYLCILLSAVFYLWFLVMYPTGGINSLKATYMLHVMPLVALLSADFLLALRGRSRRVYIVILVLLVFVVLHNIPAFVTRYNLRLLDFYSIRKIFIV